MNDNQEFYSTYHKIIGISWIIMIVVTIIMVPINIIFFPEEAWYIFSLSYLLGAMTNLFAFNLLKNNIANIKEEDSKSAITGSFTNYSVRLMIYAFILFVSFKTGKLNYFIVPIGFLTVRIAIYIYAWKSRKEG